MPTLAREPVPVTGLDDLLSAARSEAAAASAFYEDMSARMRAKGRSQLAETLNQLAAEETELGKLVPTPLHPSAESRADPQVTVSEGPYASVELADNYSIWAMAVRHADRAFARWSYAAAHAPDADVRAGAEQLARAHLIMASARRQNRRAAFHAGQSSETGSGAPLTLERLEAHLSGLLACHEIVGSPTFDPLLAQVAAQSRQAARELAASPPVSVRPLSPQALGDPGVLAEAIVDGYFDAINATTNESHLKRLQDAAAGAIRRLDAVRRAPT